MASHRGGRAARSSPAEAQGPEGPIAGQWREGGVATGTHWPQGSDSHRSGTAPSAGERWVCIKHLGDNTGGETTTWPTLSNEATSLGKTEWDDVKHHTDSAKVWFVWLMHHTSLSSHQSSAASSTITSKTLADTHTHEHTHTQKKMFSHLMLTMTHPSWVVVLIIN